MVEHSAQETDRPPGRCPERHADKKPGKELWRRLDRATGLSLGLDFARSLGGANPLGPLAQAKKQLASNLERENELEGDFARVLAAWGISEESLAAYAKARVREAIILALLCLLALAVCYANLLFPARVPLVRFLAGLACASFVAASGLMCLASAWRARVCRTRRFVPFTSWLAGLLLPASLRKRE